MSKVNEVKSSLLKRFSEAVRSWFLDTFEAPTSLQEHAWEAIESGKNALVIAPTGSGKTLAAFLFAIDTLISEKMTDKAARAGKGVRVLYVSPLKALGADVERNLQEPLAGIVERLETGDVGMFRVRTGMRTGDTTAEQRRALVRKPPDIFITTPESLYLMLTSKSRDILRTVETVIVDEVHALAGSKRGAHMALSLERLDNLLERPAQRIGLSATVRPRDEIARFLGGSHPVSIIADEGRPDMDVRVVVPVVDMTAVPVRQGFAAESFKVHGRVARSGPAKEVWKSDRALRASMDKASASTPDSRVGSSSMWPHIEAAILDEVLAHRTTIVFVNSRGLCEKLTARINELYALREGLLFGQEADGALVPSHLRSDLGSTTERGQGAPDIIAKAHHGSVSKEKRLQVERELKSGQLPCVVATSSLELGIDMGSIDLVLQVAAPPSVASALQRVGRANHQVGGRSVGIIYPRTRTEIIDAAVVSEGMREGRIENTSLVCNPLDVLAQQTVAAVAMDNLSVDAWYATVRRSASFANLTRRAFDSVLDMLAGRNNTADLSEFSPRIVFDREAGVLTARPGSQRHAVMSAGTIPDRGMFSVVLPEGSDNEGRRRVGELDEEMVYESRVGDIIALGTSSWRITEITRDRVIVEPAPGRSARLPFWHGEGVGKPAEAGRARGEFLRGIAAGIRDVDEEDEAHASVDTAMKMPTSVDTAVKVRLEEGGLDADAQSNLVELIRAQRAATGVIPHDKMLVVERCEDEEGDWRVLLHSPYGRRVHEPWAMAVSDRVTRLYGYDPQVMAADDGIMLRVPLSESHLPGAELFVFDPDELEQIVRDRVDSTSLFASRFRECAARALLMSPLAPGKRSPLWHQRLKAGQLLDAARREREFPILIEAARECLQDVYDMPALHEIMQAVQGGLVHIVEAQTSIPSPFAAPLLFGYVGEHLYLGDLPHAEQRASLLSVDTELLGELLGCKDVEQLLDEQVVREVEGELQRTAIERRVRGIEGVADLLRVLGPLSEEEISYRLRPTMEVGGEGSDEEDYQEEVALQDAEGFGYEPLAEPSEGAHATTSEVHALLEELWRVRRVFPISIGGREWWASSEDARLLRDALGVVVPSDVPAAFLEVSVCSEEQFPLDSLIARYARTHGPFATEEVAFRLGIGPSLARESLARLFKERGLVQGAFDTGEGKFKRTWVSSEVFRRLRVRSLAKARRAVQPVRQDVFVRFLLELQGIAPDGESRFEGTEGVAQVIAQFEGAFLPAEAWESHVLPSRVCNYRPSMLDDLIASGEVVWVGKRTDGSAEHASMVRGRERVASKRDEAGLVAFYPTDSPFAPRQPAWLDGYEGEFISKGSSMFSVDAGEALAAVDARASVEIAVVEALGRGGGLFFRQIVDMVRRKWEPNRIDEETIAEVLRDLVWTSRATNDTFAPIRTASESGSYRRPRSAERRRASSRRTRARSATLESSTRSLAGVAAPSISGATLSGRWSLLEPSDRSDTERALALVESILDRYGVLTRDIALLSGVPGGMSALFPVLRSMEDAGNLLRGAFVKGLGPAQFAARETIDRLRTYDNSVEKETVSRLLYAGMVVLAADDPASLFGAGLPWPDLAEEGLSAGELNHGRSQILRPARRGGALVVVRDGCPVLYATAGLRSILAFTCNNRDLADAVNALVAYVTRTVKRGSSDAARKKTMVQTFNGHPVLATPFARILQSAGFVRLPDGMRLYVAPF